MNESIGTILILSAVVTIVVGAVLIAVVGAIVGGIVLLVGIMDLLIGAFLRSGAIRPGG